MTASGSNKSLAVFGSAFGITSRVAPRGQAYVLCVADPPCAITRGLVPRVRGPGGTGIAALQALDMYAKLPYIAAMANTPSRNARLEARIAPEALALVRRAAEMQGRSVSEFVVAAAQEAAVRAIEEAQFLRLSLADQQALADSLLAPPEPAPALVMAAKALQEMELAEAGQPGA